MPFFPESGPLILLAALILDAVIGDPDWLWRRIPHPVALVGRWIGGLDRALNRGKGEAQRRLAGIAVLVALCVAMTGAALGLHHAFAALGLGIGAEIVIVAILLAQRSLYDHVQRVHAAFSTGGLPAARLSVASIVGRDPATLDQAGVCRAAIETTAENFSDGVVAPAFWYLIAGLPGLFVYKAVNTADSMIGHRTPHYAAFGWAAARLDDLLNLVPARLSAMLLIGGAIPLRADAFAAFSAMWRDARRHRSPNAGWPEAAMAGALGLALAGPRHYGGTQIDDAWMNAGGRDAAGPADIESALRLFVAACAFQAILIAAMMSLV